MALPLTSCNEVEVTIPYTEDHTVNIYFKVTRYGFPKPDLIIQLDNMHTIKLYLNEHTLPLPGIYLFKNNTIVNTKHILLTPNTWYNLIINYTKGRLHIHLKVLNKTYLAVNVTYTSSLFTQGLAFNGKYWFITRTTTIYKLTKNMSKVIKYNAKPILENLRKEEYFHLGDLDYYNNTLIIPIERKGFKSPTIIALYNPNTLKLTKYSYTPQSHMPWIAIDCKGYIYTSEFTHVKTIYVYHIKQIGTGNFIKPIRTIKLKELLERVQGGVIINDNTLALTTDDGNHIYIININNGEIEAKIWTPGFHEIEGIEAIQTDNKTHLYILYNTHESNNLIYQYTLIDKNQTLQLFNITCKPYHKVKVIYNQETIQLLNTTPITHTSPIHTPTVRHIEILLIAITITAIALLLTLLVKLKGSTLRQH